MNIRFHAGLLLLALAASAARAETRMQVSAPSTPIFVQASATSRQIGTAQAGEILFVARTENGWAAIAPPERIDLWLNKDFIEGNRVIAKSIQVRSGPGIQYEVVGTLERGAPVMPRGEEGDWCKIEPPSSMVVWVKTADLAEIKPQTTPIREVATVAAPAPAPVAPLPPAVSPAPEPIAAPVPAPPAPAPEPIAKIAPSSPGATPPPPAPRPAPAAAPAPALVAAVAAPATPSQPPPPAVAAPAAEPAKPAAPKPAPKPKPAPVPAAPTLRPATSLPAPAVSAAPVAAQPAPAVAPAKPAAQRKPAMPAVTKAIPATAGTIAAQKPREVGVEVDQALVDELDLTDEPGQGKPVQLEGELRNAPFMAASPSRYRLQGQDADGNLEFICHVHGDSRLLRGYVGQGVAIRGREYWVEASDMPVVVVGQIVPLAPADEPVMY